MNELEFLEQWNADKSMYEAWGKFIVQEITNSLKEQNINVDKFIKIKSEPRLKEDRSLLDKAFYRNKPYTDPYKEIEDKVGVRFIVLLTEEVLAISEIIKSNSVWLYDAAKDYQLEIEENPYLFSYQSLHFVLRPNEPVEFEGIKISNDTPCEVQIRTLLQHAHAELTHDSIYKSGKKAHSVVHRAVAKSMALIETTDELFCTATRTLNNTLLNQHKIVEKLDSLYISKVNLCPITQKSTYIVYEAFEQFIDESLLEKIQKLIVAKPFIIGRIQERYTFDNIFYQQSIVFFIYWLLDKRKYRLLLDWPLDRKYLEPLANDLGVSIE